MKKIITIGGSNSKNSINKKLAEYTGGKIENVELVKIDLNNFEMALFSVDFENEHSFPQKAIELNALFEIADGFIVSLAEHNGAYSTAFKNTFDWLSRIEAKVWRSKPMLLLSTSPGERGGQSVLELALNRFPYHDAKIVSNMSFPSFNSNFCNGEIINSTLKNILLQKVQQFQNAI